MEQFNTIFKPDLLLARSAPGCQPVLPWRKTLEWKPSVKHLDVRVDLRLTRPRGRLTVKGSRRPNCFPFSLWTVSRTWFPTRNYHLPAIPTHNVAPFSQFIKLLPDYVEEKEKEKEILLQFPCRVFQLLNWSLFWPQYFVREYCLLYTSSRAPAWAMRSDVDTGHDGSHVCIVRSHTNARLQTSTKKIQV